LRRILKYILILLAASAIVFLLFSCKSSKKANVAQEPVSASSRAADEIRFAHMFVNGCAERMKGNLHEALKLFEECKKIDASNPAVSYELGTIYKLLGQNDQALQHARHCAASDQQNQWYQLLLVECLNSKGQYGQAIKVRETLLKKYPERNDFKEDLAIEYAVTGQYEKSFRLYEELEKSVGVNEQLTLNKVKLLKSLKKYREAESEFLKLSASNPREPRYYAYLAELYLELNEPEKARVMYDKILEVDPDNPTVHLAYHDYYNGRRETERAFASLKKAFSNPDLDPVTKAGILGNYYRQAETGDKQAAAQGAELAALMLQVHPEVPAANALYGDFLMLDKKVAEAAPYYYSAAVREGREPRIWENLLYVDNELGKYDSLEKHSAMAIEFFPSQPRNYLYQAVAASRLGKPEKAIRSLEEGYGYITEDQQLSLDFLRLMGDTYHTLKAYEKSDKAFDDALKVNSDDAYVLNNYAYYLSIRKEHLEKAERLSKKANQLQPGNRNYMDTYGWILYQQKKFTESVEWLSAAAKLGPPNATILEHYGDVLYRSNKQSEAVKQWNAAKEAGGNNPELLRKIRERKLDD
jgi:tetratricopeptide (TPR) repeat protein